MYHLMTLTMIFDVEISFVTFKVSLFNSLGISVVPKCLVEVIANNRYVSVRIY